MRFKARIAKLGAGQGQEGTEDPLQASGGQQGCGIPEAVWLLGEKTTFGFGLLDLALGTAFLVSSVQMPPFCASPPHSQDDRRVPSGPAPL